LLSHETEGLSNVMVDNNFGHHSHKPQSQQQGLVRAPVLIWREVC
jgi:hypothetical protein